MNASHRLLVIEDDTSLSSALASVLSAEGYLVDLARRGDEGCRMSARTHYDAILTDLRLPGLGGLDVIRKLHAEIPGTPILLMTAHGTTETAIEAMKEGAYDYLLKPFEMEELLASAAASLAPPRPTRLPPPSNQPPSSAGAGPCSPCTRKSAGLPPSP